MMNLVLKTLMQIGNLHLMSLYVICEKRNRNFVIFSHSPFKPKEQRLIVNLFEHGHYEIDSDRSHVPLKNKLLSGFGDIQALGRKRLKDLKQNPLDYPHVLLEMGDAFVTDFESWLADRTNLMHQVEGYTAAYLFDRGGILGPRYYSRVAKRARQTLLQDTR